MSYRVRLTTEVQKQLWNGPDHGGHGLTDDQIMALQVTDVDVSPTTPDTFLAVDCSIPMTTPAEANPGDPPTPDPVLRTRIFLDQRTAFRLLFNGLLDETNVPRPSRRSIREVVEQQNQRFYDSLRRSADDQR